MSDGDGFAPVEDGDLAPPIGRALTEPLGELIAVLSSELFNVEIAATATDLVTHDCARSIWKRHRLGVSVPCGLVRPDDRDVPKQQTTVCHSQASLDECGHASAIALVTSGEDRTVDDRAGWFPSRRNRH